MRFIGDVHAKFDRYLQLTSEVSESIQVGDFGAGFKDIPEMGETHRFIRGNHDNPEVCRNHPNWIADGSLIGDMFFIGGGRSIDQHLRTTGLDWWPDEELSYEELCEAANKYEEVKPRIMVSHEVPLSAARYFFGKHTFKNIPGSLTSKLLNVLFTIHQPEIWICGHWHQRKDEVIEGTRFIVLEELGVIDL